MLNRILSVALKELIQIRRDPRLLRIMLMTPIIQLMVFGYAATLDIKNVPAAYIDYDKSAQSRDFLRKFYSSGYFTPRGESGGRRELDFALETGTTKVGLVISKGFSRHIARGDSTKIQLLVDGVDSNYARVAEGYAGRIGNSYSAEILKSRYGTEFYNSGNRLYYSFNKTGGNIIDLKEQVLYNPELESKNFMVPGIIVMVLLVITMISTSVAIVREKELQTLEQLIATPLSAFELIIGKLIPFTIIGLIMASTVILIALFWFGVPLVGSVFLMFLLMLLFLFNTLGLGILISVFSRTQHQAMMTAFVIMMPSVILSGMIFPISNMPKIIQLATYIIPARYFMEILRGIMLKGAGAADLSFQIICLALLGMTIFLTSLMMFKRKMR
ncbi:MAG: ABC transporter permease [Candidatus Schekmanbacteria bacterium]|nr:ABC transporter permease [Candidatus Schekmanbacteria bacterium]